MCETLLRPNARYQSDGMYVWGSLMIAELQRQYCNIDFQTICLKQHMRTSNVDVAYLVL